MSLLINEETSLDSFDFERLTIKHKVRSYFKKEEQHHDHDCDSADCLGHNKIMYHVNFLPSLLVNKEGDDLISALLMTEEIQLFNTKAVQDLTYFHWKNYA